MDYKKEYEEAVKRAKAMIKVAEKEEEVYKIAITIFPELKETEDEKIRKALIDYFDDANKSDENPLQSYGIQTDEVIAWLEKQGEPNPYSGVSFKYDGHTWGMCARDGGVEILVDGKIKERVSLDKKPQGKTALEAIKEEKVDNSNKVEPKFKVGDWVIRNAEGFKHNTYLVTGVKDYYVCEDLKGRRGTYTFNDAHKNFKLLDISDAKDGDVLVDVYGNIGICEQCDDFDWVSYCSLGCNGGFQHFKIEHENEKTYPATKKQRDTLMKAMADAGYTFDFEKKELKKIEQKPVYITDEWIEDYWQHEKVINPYSYDKGEEIQFDHQSFVRFCKKYCRKPAWSEEDERILDAIVTSLNNEYFTRRLESLKGIGVSPVIDWLKSLKDRVQTLAKIEK